MRPPVIIGAGLSGLIAGHAWPSLEIVEAAEGPKQMHHALLRFRTDSVARLTGIEFKKVRVRKGIWSDGKFREPDIQLANRYAMKVLSNLIGERSIWNLAPADRFIAPPSFYEQLLESTNARIHWGQKVNFSEIKENSCYGISTAPLPVMLAQLGIGTTLKFGRAPITVVRCNVPGADIYQTIYFPNDNTPMYRASITGDLLIIEAMTDANSTSTWLPAALDTLSYVFAFKSVAVLDIVEQSYGKIAEVDNDQRKKLLFKLTHDHNIFSLGRFATWKNILLDDLPNDIDIIKRLMRGNSYDLNKEI
jgi:hypothetical protein